MNSDAKPQTIKQKWNRRYADLPTDAQTNPAPFVARCLPLLPTTGEALDVAAGAGRHAIALGLRGLLVDAVDISAQGLLLTRRRAASVGLTPREVRCIVADIEQPWLPCTQYDVIVVSFFLYRPLLPLIKTRLKTGGWLIYETLIQPDDEPACDFWLAPGELQSFCSDLTIKFYHEGPHHSPGRHAHKSTAQLLAQR